MDATCSRPHSCQVVIRMKAQIFAGSGVFWKKLYLKNILCPMKTVAAGLKQGEIPLRSKTTEAEKFTSVTIVNLLLVTLQGWSRVLALALSATGSSQENWVTSIPWQPLQGTERVPAQELVTAENEGPLVKGSAPPCPPVIS